MSGHERGPQAVASFLAAVRHLSRRQRLRAIKTPPFFTGAVVRGNCLYVATIGDDSRGRRRLIASRSGEFILKDRDQKTFQIFQLALEFFLSHREIEHVMLACSPEKGPHMATAAGYKIEALLQVAPIFVDTVNATALTRFGYRDDICVPGPDRRKLSGAAANFQQRAILAAAYAADQARLYEENRA